MLWMSLWVWNKTEPGEGSSPREVGTLPFVTLPYVNEIAFFPPCPFTGLRVSCLHTTLLICWKREAVFFDLLISLSHQTRVPPFHFIHEEMGVQKGFQLRFSSLSMRLSKILFRSFSYHLAILLMASTPWIPFSTSRLTFVFIVFTCGTPLGHFWFIVMKTIPLYSTCPIHSFLRNHHVTECWVTHVRTSILRAFYVRDTVLSALRDLPHGILIPFHHHSYPHITAEDAKVQRGEVSWAIS